MGRVFEPAGDTQQCVCVSTTCIGATTMCVVTMNNSKIINNFDQNDSKSVSFVRISIETTPIIVHA